MAYVQTDDFPAYIEKIVAGCKNGERQAWEALFQLKYRTIANSIAHILATNHQTALSKDLDVKAEIFLSIYETALKKIQDLKHPLAVDKWLGKIVFSRTMDFLRSHNTKRNLIQSHLQKQTQSLAQPISANSTKTIEETIPAPEPQQALQHVIDEIHQEIEQLKPIEKWIFALKTIFYNPLGPDEIKELAAFLNKPAMIIEQLIHELMDDLVCTAAAKAEDLDSAGRLQAKIDMQISRLLERRAQLERPEKLDIYTNVQIQRRAKRMAVLEKAGQQPIAPSNQQIASILGIDQEKAQEVSNMLNDSRKRLKKTISYRTYKDIAVEDPGV